MTAFAFSTHLQQKVLQDLTDMGLFESVLSHDTVNIISLTEAQAHCSEEQQNQSSSDQGFGSLRFFIVNGALIRSTKL